MPVFGVLHSKVDPKWVIAAGEAIVIVGNVLFSRNSFDTTYWRFTFPATILISVGTAAFFVNNINIAVSLTSLHSETICVANDVHTGCRGPQGRSRASRWRGPKRLSGISCDSLFHFWVIPYRQNTCGTLEGLSKCFLLCMWIFRCCFTHYSSSAAQKGLGYTRPFLRIIR